MIGTIQKIIKAILDKLFTSLGLVHKKGTILFLGLDNAGKTTFLHKLQTNKALRNYFPPTQRAHEESFTHEGITFHAWDIGGHEAVRHLWEDYVCNVQGVLFLIDAVDVNRLEEVKDELDALIHDSVLLNVDKDDDTTHGPIPLAIMLNKCDDGRAVSNELIAQQIGYLDEIIPFYQEKLGSTDCIKMFRMSVYRGEGYQEALRWIATFL